jgi:hypothetical protein
MTASWIVRAVYEDTKNPPHQGEPTVRPFSTEDEAVALYDRLLEKGLPQDCGWMELFLDQRESQQNPPRKTTRIVRHHNVVRSASGEECPNDLSRIIQV